jgi:hypothetical protein
LKRICLGQKSYADMFSDKVKGLTSRHDVMNVSDMKVHRPCSLDYGVIDQRVNAPTE